MNSLPRARRPVKLSKDEILRRLRLGDLRRLFADRCRGPSLPDDDAGRDYLKELLLPISLGPHEAVKRPGAVKLWGPTDRMRREIELWAPWMSDDEARELIDEVNLMPTWQRKPKARTLGERLSVPYGERARLHLRTIGPCDMTEKAMALIRKQRKRQRDKLRRQRRPRAEYLAASISQTKPWIEEGISRRAWYYRLKKANCTGVHPINLTKTGRTLVQTGNSEGTGSECGRPSTATPAGQTETYADIWAEEAVWQSTWGPSELAAAA